MDQVIIMAMVDFIRNRIPVRMRIHVIIRQQQIISEVITVMKLLTYWQI